MEDKPGLARPRRPFRARAVSSELFDSDSDPPVPCSSTLTRAAPCCDGCAPALPAPPELLAPCARAAASLSRAVGRPGSREEEIGLRSKKRRRILLLGGGGRTPVGPWGPCSWGASNADAPSENGFCVCTGKLLAAASSWSSGHLQALMVFKATNSWNSGGSHQGLRSATLLVNFCKESLAILSKHHQV